MDETASMYALEQQNRPPAAVVEAFHAALDAYSYARISHARGDAGWVDDAPARVVKALLDAGWAPPSPARDQ